MQEQRKKNGFTLVEISLVLVVIGLVVSGVIVSQSIIESSRISSDIGKIAQFDSAVSSFYGKYKQLPGDSGRAGGSAGDGSGFIDQGINTFSGETAQFWGDLVRSGFSEQGFDGIDLSAASGFDDNNVPKSDINGDASVVVIGALGSGNYYLFSIFDNTVPSAIAMDDAYTPIQVLSVDQKIDDGVANTGNVLATDEDQLDVSILTTPTVETDCVTVAAGGVYAVDQDDLTCSMLVRIGISSGQLF